MSKVKLSVALENSVWVNAYSPQGGLFVTDITGSGNIAIERKPAPNESEIIGVSFENANNITVSVEWDRQKKYEGLPTVNGISVNRSSRNGSTFTGTVLIPVVGETIIAKYNATETIINVNTLSKPTLTASFVGTLPGSQTELKSGDVYPITVTPSEDITDIQVQNSGACVSSSRIENATEINAIIADRGNTLQQLTANVRVKNTTGTWSDWATTTNTAPCNNQHPVIVTTLKQYPGTQLALKDNEECSITTTSQYSDSKVVTTSSNLLPTATGCTRMSGGYETGTHTTTSIRNANNATTVHNESIRIANDDVDFSSNTPTQVRSGLGAVTLRCLFDQDLLTPVTDPTITATDANNHSDSILYENVTAVNLANKTMVLQRAYKIKGFAQKTLSLTFPDMVAEIGCNVVDLSNLSVTGTIGSVPPYSICQSRVATADDITLVSQYALTNNQTEITVDGQKCSDFGYSSSTGITITAEET